MSDKEGLQTRFLEEYPTSAKRLEANLDRMKLEYEHVSPAGNKNTTLRYIHYRRNEKCRIDFFRSGIPDCSYVTTENDTFKVIQNTDTSRWYIASLESLSQKRYGASMELMRTRVSLPSRVHALYDTPITDFINEDRFKITSIESTGDDGEKRVIVTWESPLEMEQGDLVERNGSFTFAPAADWQLEHYTFGANEELYNEGKIDYEFVGSVGASVPVHFVEWRVEGDHRRVVEEVNLVSASRIEGGGDDLFQLSHFGIPNEVRRGG